MSLLLSHAKVSLPQRIPRRLNRSLRKPLRKGKHFASAHTSKAEPVKAVAQAALNADFASAHTSKAEPAELHNAASTLL